MSRYFAAFVVMVLCVSGSSWLENQAAEPAPPGPSGADPLAGSPDDPGTLVAYQQPPSQQKKQNNQAKKGGNNQAKNKNAPPGKTKPAGKNAPPAKTKPAEKNAPLVLPPEEPAELPKASRDAVMKAWNSPAMTKSWDLSKLTPDDEDRLGEQLNALVVASTPTVEGGTMPRRLREAAEPIAALGQRKGDGYKFVVLDTESVNAFSHPGGYVYLTRGMMDWVGEEQDHVLEFILAHEIAHIDMRHAIKCLQDPKVENLVDGQKKKYGTLQKFFLLIFPLGYLKEQDAEADRWAFERMKGLDRTKREGLAFLRKLETYSEANEFANGRGKPVKLGPDASPVDNHLRAHSAPYDRLKALEKLASSGPAAKGSPGGSR
jgi:Zn-dependent protease with chaperone function